jgi:hypothetical protein
MLAKCVEGSLHNYLWMDQEGYGMTHMPRQLKIQLSKALRALLVACLRL